MLLENVKIIWLGSVIGILNNELTIPFMTLDNAPKGSNNAPLDGTLQKFLLDRVNNHIGSANELAGIDTNVSIDTNNIKVNLDDFVGAEEAGANADYDKVMDLIHHKLDAFSRAVKLDENNRVAYTSFNVEENSEITFEGDIVFEEDGTLKLEVKKLTRTHTYDDQSFEYTLG